MKNHFILDFETMSADAFVCAAVECSYLVFDFDRFTSDNPYKLNELISESIKDKFDVSHQVKNYKFKVDQDTVDWWMKQSASVRALARPSDDDITLDKFMQNICAYLASKGPIKQWWSRSNTFDPIILTRIAEHTGHRKHLENLLKHYLVRDTRTFIDAKTNFNHKHNAFCPIKDTGRWEKEFKQHDSRYDIAADILRLQTLIRLDNNLEMPE